MRTRTLAVSLGLVGVLALSAACGSSGDAAGTGSTGTADDPVEITFWSSIVNMGPVVDAFNDEHPTIKVTFEEIPSGAAGGYAKLSAALSAGNAPDVATIEYPNLADYASQGQLTAASDISDDDLLAPYSEGIGDLVSFGGKTWAMPYDAPPMVYYYRADLFEQAGIDGPPATWEEYADAARAYKETFPDSYIGAFYPNDSTMFAGLAWQNGADWFSTGDDAWKVSIDDPASQEVAEFWQELVDEDLVKVEQVFSDEWSSDLASSTIASTIGASWSTSGIIARTADQAGDWRVAQLPGYGTDATALLGGSTFAVTKDSDSPEAALELARWLTTSPEAVTARGEVGSAVLADPALTDLARENFPLDHFGGQEVYDVFDEAAASVVPGWAWGPTMTSTSTSLGDEFAKVTSGTTLGQALETVQKSTVADLTKAGLAVSE